jgi:LysM repeat protein
MVAQASQPAIVISPTPEQTVVGTEGSGATSLPPSETPLPPTETPLPATAVPTRPESYKLNSGEWPICIARRFDLDLDSFFAANNLNMQSRPSAGTVLKIPQTGNWSTASGTRSWHAHPTQYTIQSSDNIYSIACYFGDIEPDAILTANGLSGSFTLSAGQELQIP